MMAPMFAPRIALCVSLALFSLALAAPSHAQEPQPADQITEARGLFLAGRAAFNEARYEAALKYFQAAHEQSHKPALIYNIAQCEDRLGHQEQALAAFERYLAEEPGTPHRELVQERITALRAELAAQPPPQANLQVAPEAPIAQPALGAEHIDTGSQRKRIQLAPMLTVAGGALLTATGSVLMIVGRSRGDDIESGHASTHYETVRSEAESAERMWIGGQLLVVVGAAALVGGTTWWVLRGRAQRNTLQAGLTPMGLRLEKRF